jgi:hypothetical protein
MALIRAGRLGATRDEKTPPAMGPIGFISEQKADAAEGRPE